jgi:hypothetical protein
MANNHAYAKSIQRFAHGIRWSATQRENPEMNGPVASVTSCAAMLLAVSILGPPEQ